MANQTAETTQAAVAEATRIASEAQRRTVDSARAAVDATRGYLDQSTALTRDLFTAWVAGTEATLKATFEIQNTALASGVSVLDTAAATNRKALEQWVAVTRNSQDTVLEAFRANVTALEKLSGEPAKR